MKFGISRRLFLQTGGLALGAAAVPLPAAANTACGAPRKRCDHYACRHHRPDLGSVPPADAEAPIDLEDQGFGIGARCAGLCALGL